MQALAITEKEVRLVALMVGMFVDQKIDKKRMLRLCKPVNLAKTYDFINRPTDEQSK